MESPLQDAKESAALECARLCESIATDFAISDGDPDGDGFDKSRSARVCAAKIKQAFGLPLDEVDKKELARLEI